MLDKANNFILKLKFCDKIKFGHKKTHQKNLMSLYYYVNSRRLSILISSAQKYSQNIPEQKHYR